MVALHCDTNSMSSGKKGKRNKEEEKKINKISKQRLKKKEKWKTTVRNLKYTYIHNWPLQPFSQDYWPSFSHHIYISGGIYSLKSTPNNRFFEKLFMAILFILRVIARNLLSGNRRRNTFRISFWCLAWDSNPGFSSNKPTHYFCI